MKRAICIDIEEEDYCCNKRNHYNQCCQQCDDNACNGCDYRYDSSCPAKEWIED